MHATSSRHRCLQVKFQRRQDLASYCPVTECARRRITLDDGKCIIRVLFHSLHTRISQGAHA
uniref:Uncharacterized protein n=1 Tax=Triticum urartu TaxID=4572 RepID=A0A8R7UX74_TRIUA